MEELIGSVHTRLGAQYFRKRGDTTPDGVIKGAKLPKTRVIWVKRDLAIELHPTSIPVLNTAVLLPYLFEEFRPQSYH